MYFASNRVIIISWLINFNMINVLVLSYSWYIFVKSLSTRCDNWFWKLSPFPLDALNIHKKQLLS